MRFSFDTNILVYALDRDAGERHRIAVDLLVRSRGKDCFITLQALAELFRTLTGRKAMPVADAANHIQAWRDAVPVIAADESCLIDAMDAVAHSGWSFGDAMIWATVKKAGCRLLISEDGQDGRTLGGVTIVNPFKLEPSPLLREALHAGS